MKPIPAAVLAKQMLKVMKRLSYCRTARINLPLWVRLFEKRMKRMKT